MPETSGTLFVGSAFFATPSAPQHFLGVGCRLRPYRGAAQSGSRKKMRVRPFEQEHSSAHEQVSLRCSSVRCLVHGVCLRIDRSARQASGRRRGQCFRKRRCSGNGRGRKRWGWQRWRSRRRPGRNWRDHRGRGRHRRGGSWAGRWPRQRDCGCRYRDATSRSLQRFSFGVTAKRLLCHQTPVINPL